jgi:hypothetical protein
MCQPKAAIFPHRFMTIDQDDVQPLMETKRRKPRIPGGSGCDDPRDVREHPECRVKA